MVDYLDVKTRFTSDTSYCYKVPIGVIKRGETTTVALTGKAGQTLDILLEIQGHITAGSGTNNDSKASI